MKFSQIALVSVAVAGCCVGLRAYQRVADFGFGDAPLDARKARLLDVLQDTDVRSLKYLYDFGDGWEHTVRIERVTEPVPAMAYPRLIGRACGMEKMRPLALKADIRASGEDHGFRWAVCDWRLM